MPATYDSLATTTLGAAASSITFSSISSAYTDLKIIFHGSSASGAYPKIRLNGDTATNYSNTYFYGYGGGSLGSNTQENQNAALLGTDSMNGSWPACYVIDILSYTSTIRKSILSFAAQNVNNSNAGFTSLVVNEYRGTSAINSLTILDTGGVNFDAGTIATLYGILRA